jgi:hypothetical protein
MPSDRYFIKLHVTGDGNKRWKMTWQDPNWPDRHYHVDESILHDIGKQVRGALQRVVDDARGKVPLAPAMKDLARKGADLRNAIFLARGEGAYKAQEIRDDYLPGRDNWTLLISLDQRVHIPWGLAYDGDPEVLPDNCEDAAVLPSLYEDFWCLKYQISTLLDIVDPTGIFKPRANNEIRMLTVVNKACWDTAEQRIPPSEKALFDSGLARSHPIIASSADFFRQWKLLHKDVDLLYIYCHANGSNLALSGDDEITTAKFSMEVNHKPLQTHPVCLVFLNGCQTAIGAEGGGFIEATGSLGFCGFIGTEAKVPDLFAMRFAGDFFCHMLYDEMNVAETMNRLRREHWPLGLVYSTCCHPEFKIKRVAAAPFVRPSRNLSIEPLMANTLL